MQRVQPYSGKVVDLVGGKLPTKRNAANAMRFVPEGLNESSPAIYCWEKKGRCVRPGGTIEMIESGHSIGLAGTNDTLSSLAGRFFVKKNNPPLKCWATFIESLRDRSSEARRSTLDCQLVMLSTRRRGTGSWELWPIALVRPARCFLANLIQTQFPCSKKS